MVIPTLDLVIVHRVDRDNIIPEPSGRSIARLFWLILKAAGHDPGPDVSLAAAVGERPTGEDIRTRVQGRTIGFGAGLKDGPFTMRFEPDGRISYPHWDEAAGPANGAFSVLGPASGTWSVEEDRLCIINARRRCYVPVLNGDRVELFGRFGVMEFDAVALPQ